jgi:hypothetical protein
MIIVQSRDKLDLIFVGTIVTYILVTAKARRFKMVWCPLISSTQAYFHEAVSRRQRTGLGMSSNQASD